MRKRPSWTVRREVEPVPATWAVSTVEEEPEPIALPPPAPLRPSTPPRLSLVPPPPGPSEADELRARIASLESELAATRAAAEAATARHEEETRALVAARAALLEEARAAVVRLATAIAERAVGAELVHSPALIEQWTAEAVAILGGGERVGDEVSFEGSVVEVTPAARVAAIAAALDDRKAA